MEPNPYHVGVHLRDAPFVAGDVVRYTGTTPSTISSYAGNREHGIVVWCRRGHDSRHWDEWRVGVDWSDRDRKRGRYNGSGGAKLANYLAKNLTLVRSIARGGWVWPQPEALRAEDV